MKSEEIFKIVSKYLKMIFDICMDFVKEGAKMIDAKSLLKEREHNIVALKEYVDLIEILGSGEELAVEALFLGFSAESIGANRVVLYFYDEKEKFLYPNAVLLYKNRKVVPYDFYSDLKDLKIKEDEDFCGYVLKNKKPILLTSVENAKEYKGIVDKRIKMKINSIIGIPLILEDKIFGVIEIANSVENRILTSIDFYVASIIAKLTLVSMEKTKLYSWAITDNLTQLYNYHFMEIALDKEICRAKRYPQDVAGVIFDIDNFKQINDNYGHLSGNIVLKEVANVIKSSVRKNIDIPIRYGGDEFLVLLPETDLTGAKEVAKRILKNVQNLNFKFKTKQVNVTISAGVSGVKKNQIIDKTKFIKKMDDALYEAKRKGKNRVVSKV